MSQHLTIPGLDVTSLARPVDPRAEVRAIRAQAGLVRALLDELDDLTRPDSGRLDELVAGQSIEELTQLAARMLEAAAAIAPHRMGAVVLHKGQVPPACEVDPADR